MEQEGRVIADRPVQRDVLFTSSLHNAFTGIFMPSSWLVFVKTNKKVETHHTFHSQK